MAENFFAKKSVETLIAQAEEKEHKLKKVLGPVDLTFLGIGAIIGTGIFVLTGVAAAVHAGPAVIVSFVISGLACALAALCYAEFASMIPVAGSAYTYAYAGLGELLAWVIGWDLILEYTVASMTVAVGWSGYMVNLLDGLGIHLPQWATQRPFNLPAVLIVALMTIILVKGIQESAKFNNFIVVVKLAVIVFFIGMGLFFLKPANWSPFVPFGFGGIMTGAAIVFFAYIGFDAVSTTAEEARNPQRDLPIGIIASLIICTILYIAVAAILTGMIDVHNLAKDQSFLSAPIAFALKVVKQNWASAIISVGAIAGITSVLLVMLMGQPRVFFAMSRDRLLPEQMSKIHPRFQTPWITTILTGVVAALGAMAFPIDKLAEMTNIGTLFAFAIVSSSVILLRVKSPAAKRPFRVPLFFLLAPLSIISSLYLMLSLPVLTWVRFLIWLDLGLLIYYFYGRRHSRLADPALRRQKIDASSALKFFGFGLFANAALAGLLCLTTITGLTALRNWEELKLTPHDVLPYIIGTFVLGVVLFVLGNRMKSKAPAKA
ncbi:MAG: amino acid permease [Candidatus Aminicenantes bacterium]|nr:amino acid permease [Candidatus Aminicenantes bacterium]